MREPIDLKLPDKVRYYNAGTDAMVDLRTGKTLKDAAVDESIGYTDFSTWFKNKVSELEERWREDGITSFDPATNLALSVAIQLGQKHAS